MFGETFSLGCEALKDNCTSESFEQFYEDALALGQATSNVTLLNQIWRRYEVFQHQPHRAAEQLTLGWEIRRNNLKPKVLALDFWAI